MRGRSVFALAVLAALALWLPSAARATKPNAPTTLTVDLPGAYADVLQAVTAVVVNGTVSGSAEYEKDKLIAGAQAGDAGQAFAPWTGPGKVVYKLRTHTLAPSHFLDSADVGTVVVRYVVQELNPATTRVVIDAAFIEDGRHRRHPSDGAVEAGELAEVQNQLRIQEQQKLEAGRRHEAEELAQLEETAEQEKKQLESVLAEIVDLEQRAQALRHQLLARVKSGGELKAAPYSRASGVRSLAQGELVEVLSSSARWCRVRDQQGQEGWISSSLVEALP